MDSIVFSLEHFDKPEAFGWFTYKELAKIETVISNEVTRYLDSTKNQNINPFLNKLYKEARIYSLS